MGGIGLYCCIDLKSFYASVECVDRGLDPFKANLVVADPDRSKGTICLAVSPAMKALGVKNRCRIYEIPDGINYIVAKPRMKLYMDKSAEIYSIYLRYISPEDIHVYSVDECFIDLKDYEKLYGMQPVALSKMLIDEVFRQTGIRATVGIGTNLFLAKVALDITAKHSKDFMGYLDEDLFKKTIWHHRPITDVWNVGPGIAKRLAKYGIHDLYGVATAPEELLYREFGINAELLIDHSKGIEPCTIKDIQSYKTKSSSISHGQVLFSDYSYTDARIILREMVDQLVLELVDKGLVCDGISLSIGYAEREKKHTGGSIKIGVATNSFHKIYEQFERLYDKTVDKSAGIRKVNVGLNNLMDETYSTYDLFTDVKQEEKEHKLLETVVNIKKRYGKNSLMKGTSYQPRATARERNKMIGGHNGGEEKD